MNPGANAGTDCNGREIKIGDRVRVGLNLGDPYMNAAARSLAAARREFVVVHAGRVVGYGNDVYLYLDAGKEIGQRLPQDAPGRDLLPREINGNPA